MTAKEIKFFSQEIWYHGTTLNEWKSICRNGIICNYNIGTSLDFGCGFYLSPSKSNTESYAINTAKYNLAEEEDANIPIVLEFNYTPLCDIEDENNVRYFANYDEEFAKFVFECRKNYLSENTHPYIITAGVMTDTFPAKVMQEYFSGERTMNSVVEEFKKGTSRKQLCLHTQRLCDKLVLSKAYIVNGKELDINEFTKK